MSPEEKEAFALAARHQGLSVSDYLRWWGHQGVFSEMDAESAKQLVSMKAQSLLDMLASGRAATFRAEEGRAKVARVIARAEARIRRKSSA